RSRGLDRLSYPREPRKGLHEPETRARHGAGDKSRTGQDEQPSHDAFDTNELGAKSQHEPREWPAERGRRDEWQAEAGRVYGKKAGAPRDGALGRGEGEDSGEHRTDAGCPSESERAAHDIRAGQTGRPSHIKAGLPHQHGNAGETEKMKTHK